MLLIERLIFKINMNLNFKMEQEKIEKIEKIDIKNYNIEKFTFYKPMKTKIGLNSKLTYESNEFEYETPKCKIIDTDNEKYCKISFNFLKHFSHFEFLSNLEKKCFEQIKKMNKNMTIDNYRSCIEHNDEFLTINVKLVPKSNYFNKRQYMISKYDLQKNDEVILLLNTKGIWMDENSCTLKWNCFQLVKLT
jgi:hypothetical protein